MHGTVIPILVLLALIAICGIAYWIARSSKASLARIVEESLALSEIDPSPLVNLSFCAYRCYFFHWEEVPFRFRLPYTTARLLLRRLHYYTLRWGWWGPAALVIPWSCLTYIIECRRLRRQLLGAETLAATLILERRDAPAQAPVTAEDERQSEQTTGMPVNQGYSSSSRKVIGCSYVALCLVLVVGTVGLLLEKEWAAAACCGVVTLFLGSVAYDWLHERA